MPSLKIGFLLGSPRISGGTYVIFEHASRLTDTGHQIIIITRKPVQPDDYAWHSAGHRLQWKSLEETEDDRFDIILATWWQSPFLLHTIRADHYVYFVQSIETRFFQPPDHRDLASQDDDIWQYLCEQTYAYNLPVITEARWIQKYLYSNYNNLAWLVHNGIRKDIYTAGGTTIAPRVAGRLRVLVEGPVDVAYKNVPKSIRLAKQAGVDEIWLLTSSPVIEFPDVDQVFSQVPIHETPAIYRSCDVLVKLSYVEGMFGPPLEIFHCGGTALVYEVTGHDEYMVHDRNSFVVEPDDDEGVVRLLQRLKSEPDLLDRLKQGAAETAAAWPDWAASSGEFEKALLAIAEQRPDNREYLANRHTELFDTVVPMLKAQKIKESFESRERAIWKGEGRSRVNFVEFYWHSDGEFNKDQCEWKHYSSEEWAEFRFTTDVDDFPFWLRIDPSVRVGMIRMEYIIVRNTTRQTKLMAFREADEFSVLLLTGDAKWLLPDRKNTIFSFGEDPVLVLPALGRSMADIGDTIEVLFKLKETSLQQFFEEYRTVSIPQNQEAEPAADPSPVWWNRLLPWRE